jgi:hypothetical protein
MNEHQNLFCPELNYMCATQFVANPDFSGKVPHFSAKHKIFLQAVKQ